uniref:Uncharacterized protein n=1 Tax=Romanomermis culicivorax TaxID=13658 RepID=A0A915J1B5_ROMCU
MTSAQMLSASAQPQPLAPATNSLTEVANAFEETLRALKDDISIMDALPFPTATAPQSQKIGILHEVHLCRGLVINFPCKEPISSKDDEE